MVDALAKACRMVPKFHIPEDAPLEARIRKLATGVHDAKDKVANL